MFWVNYGNLASVTTLDTKQLSLFFSGNAYSAHSKNVIMSMLADDSREVCEKAVNSVLKIRDGAILGGGSV